MNKIRTFLTTVAGLLLTSTDVLAFSLSFEERINNEHIYTVTLETNESLNLGDQLILYNLSGVTAASANSPYTIEPGDFDGTSANFTVDTPTNGFTTLTGVITLTSPDDLNNLEYQAFYSDNGTPRVAFGNNTPVPVPFDISPNLGIILLLCIWGLRQLQRRLNTND